MSKNRLRVKSILGSEMILEKISDETESKEGDLFQIIINDEKGYVLDNKGIKEISRFFQQIMKEG